MTCEATTCGSLRWGFLFLILSAFLEGMAGAQEFPYVYRSAYFLGRGDTGIAIADEEEAIFYNPAGLAFGKGIYKHTVLVSPMVEFSRTTKDVAKQIGLQDSDPIDSLRKQLGRPQHVGVNQFTGVILRRAAIGAFAHGSSTAMLYKDPTRGALESIYARSVSDGGITFSLAEAFFSKKRFLAGFTAKYFKRSQAGFEASAVEANKSKGLKADELSMLGTGASVDLGMMYRGEGRTPVSFGLTIADVGNTRFTPDQPTSAPRGEWPLKEIKQTVNLGFAVEPGTAQSRFRLLADYRDILEATKMTPYKKIHLGLELTVRNAVGFTAGMNQGYGTFGVYADLRFLRFDVGGYTEEVGKRPGSRPDQRYYFKIALGI